MPDTNSSGCLIFTYVLSINVAVLCVIRVGLVIVGTNPEEINASRRSRVMPWCFNVYVIKILVCTNHSVPMKSWQGVQNRLISLKRSLSIGAWNPIYLTNTILSKLSSISINIDSNSLFIFTVRSSRILYWKCSLIYKATPPPLRPVLLLQIDSQANETCFDSNRLKRFHIT